MELELGQIQTRMTLELELELIQTRMTQKPMLWVEVSARAWRRKSSVRGGVGQVRVCKAL